MTRFRTKRGEFQLSATILAYDTPNLQTNSGSWRAKPCLEISLGRASFLLYQWSYCNKHWPYIVCAFQLHWHRIPIQKQGLWNKTGLSPGSSIRSSTSGSTIVWGHTTNPRRISVYGSFDQWFSNFGRELIKNIKIKLIKGRQSLGTCTIFSSSAPGDSDPHPSLRTTNFRE